MLRVDTLKPGDSYMHQWTGPALVQLMACCLFGAKPLPRQMMTYCQLDPKEPLDLPDLDLY